MFRTPAQVTPRKILLQFRTFLEYLTLRSYVHKQNYRLCTYVICFSIGHTLPIASTLWAAERDRLRGLRKACRLPVQGYAKIPCSGDCSPHLQMR